MKKWEYDTIRKVNGFNPELERKEWDLVKSAGKLGWELIVETETHWLLKREIT